MMPDRGFIGLLIGLVSVGYVCYYLSEYRRLNRGTKRALRWLEIGAGVLLMALPLYQIVALIIFGG